MSSDAPPPAGPDRFQRLGALFNAAIALPPEQRAGMLRASCDDTAMLKEVGALLAEDARAIDLEAEVSRLAADAAARTPAAHAASAPPEIPGFAILRLIGRGGMGEVYEAEQAVPRRRVALKVIRPEAVGPALLRRFELEAEFLARLDHPGIATIFETGTTGEGASRRPYLAMELVDGVPLTEHVAARDLELRPRLELFCDVCDAVRHAHERGVIHRDLKPANILVRADGRARVVDFGVARAAAEPGKDLATLAAQTQDGQIVGTLSYMSPEQIRGDVRSIDTRADVYALGVVLFELLTGELPHGDEGRSLFAMVRRITEAPTPRASSLDPRLRGDLDVIIAKALEKSPSHRYQSVSDLAADLRRHLRSEPILARPPSTVYHLGRFAARNRSLVAAVIAVFIVLVGALAAVSISLAEASRQRLLAERRADILAGVNGFLTEDVIAAADPWSGGDAAVSLVAALDAAAPKIKDRFGADPATEAAVREALGRAYLNLSLLDNAAPHIELAHEMSLNLGDPGSLVDRANLLATLLLDTGRYNEAAAMLERTLELVRVQLPRDRKRRTVTLSWLANAYGKLGRNADAARLYGELVADGRRVAPDSRDTINFITSLAIIHQQLAELDKAEPLTLEAAQRSAVVFGEEHPDTLTAQNNLAMLYMRLNRYDDAEPVLLRVLEARRRVLGDEHRHTSITKSVLARLYTSTGRYEEAETHALDSLTKFTATLGADHGYTATARGVAAKLYEAWGKPEEAAKYAPPAAARPPGG